MANNSSGFVISANSAIDIGGTAYQWSEVISSNTNRINVRSVDDFPVTIGYSPMDMYLYILTFNYTGDGIEEEIEFDMDVSFWYSDFGVRDLIGPKSIHVLWGADDYLPTRHPSSFSQAMWVVRGRYTTFQLVRTGAYNMKFWKITTTVIPLGLAVTRFVNSEDDD